MKSGAANSSHFKTSEPAGSRVSRRSSPCPSVQRCTTPGSEQTRSSRSPSARARPRPASRSSAPPPQVAPRAPEPRTAVPVCWRPRCVSPVFARFLPGKLFCLYSEEFASRDMRPLKPAEMQEANLTSMVLFMKRVDIAGLGHCDFMNRPGRCRRGLAGLLAAALPISSCPPPS